MDNLVVCLKVLIHHSHIKVQFMIQELKISQDPARFRSYGRKANQIYLPTKRIAQIVN